MNRRKLVALAGTGIAGLAGCSSSGTESVENNANNKSETGTGNKSTSDSDSGTDSLTTESVSPSSEISIEESGSTVDTSMSTEAAYATATVVNSGSGRSSTINLTAKFYDSDGNLLGNRGASLTSLTTDETWDAQIRYLGSDATDVDSVEISGEVGSSTGIDQSKNLSVTQSSLDKGEYGNVKATGIIKNGRDATLDYLQSNVKFYADETTVLTSNYTNVRSVAAGETWSFEVRFNDGRSEEVNHIEIRPVDSAL